MQVEEFHYRLRASVGGLRPGMHRGSLRGDGARFHRHVTLLERADPRRLDIDASARDPFARLLFRAYRQHVASTVVLLADLSASMYFNGRSLKIAMLAGFLATLAHSVARSGDRLGVFGWDAELREDFLLPPSQRRGSGIDMAARLRALPRPVTDRRRGATADGLVAAAQRLGARHSLVFIASDFHFPLATLARVLPMLASHTVVPLVLVDAAEQTLPRGRGLVRVNDMESGSERTLWLRPGLAARLAEQAAARREQFDALCHRHGCPPLHMVDRFDADAVTRYFYQ